MRCGGLTVNSMRFTYLLFGRYGFIRHTLPQIPYRLWFRLRHGFWDYETWSLNTNLASWLAPRLKHFAENHKGSPRYYPNKNPDNPEEDTTDHEAWTNDLHRAAAALAAYAKYEELNDWPAELKVIDDGNAAMAWIAEWFGGLWD